MTVTLPAGYLDLDDAVERMARTARNGNLYPAIVYRDEAAAAWRKLCKLAPAAARILTADGLIRTPDPVQFEGFADKYWKFASTPRYPPNDNWRLTGDIERYPSYELLDTHGRLHRGARLVFLESEIEATLWMIMEPATQVEAIAKWLREKYPSRPAIPSKELARIVKESFGAVSRTTLWRAMKLAWPETN